MATNGTERPFCSAVNDIGLTFCRFPFWDFYEIPNSRVSEQFALLCADDYRCRSSFHEETRPRILVSFLDESIIASPRLSIYESHNAAGD
jgi:hypothetical protein